MKIKKFKEFESISGWELVGQHVMGPAYPEQELAVTLASSDTETLMGSDGNFYTYDDYQDLLQKYQQKSENILDGGNSKIKDFTKSNLDLILSKIKS